MKWAVIAAMVLLMLGIVSYVFKDKMIRAIVQSMEGATKIDAGSREMR